MDDPIKVLFKFKNDNRRTQYFCYIFVGEVPQIVLNVLKSIQDKSLSESLQTLDEINVKKLERQYGEYWYKKFFNTYHINHSIELIKKNPKLMKDLEKKYGAKWIQLHIGNHRTDNKLITYSYDQTVSYERNYANYKKNKFEKKTEDDDNIDYRLVYSKGKEDKKVKSKVEVSSVGGNIDSDVDENESIKEDITKELFNSYIELIGGSEEEDEVLESFDDVENDIDIEDLEKIYEDVYKDTNSNDTSKLIKEALDNDKAYKKEMNSAIKFDKNKDKNTFDEELKDVYDKIYVHGVYIFKDDTIRMIKQKICCSILNNDKFGEKSYIIPSRQYLFSEYIFENQVEKVMLGQKWVRKNDILKIDIEPVNLPYYEDLRGNLKTLRDNLKRYGNRIKWEDDDSNILYDYDNYYTNNEIFLIDIYNELGPKYIPPDAEALKNITDVYINIYFRRIKNDDIKQILAYLSDTKSASQEKDKLESTYIAINNDVVLDKYVMSDVENVKKTMGYKHLFKDNFITQSVINLTLRLENPNSKINLYRIFSAFDVSDKYPFMQYQTSNGQVNFKYSESNIAEFSTKKKNREILTKWFEKSPYGISFKVKAKENDNDKFMDINMNEHGKIEYRTRWKETDVATIKDIHASYEYIKDLIRKINEENNKVSFVIPKNEDFKYSFINSIQRFSLPEGYTIDHNDLSDFSRYFYPYVSLVIDPRKRKSKNKNNLSKSKYGTYLRYKRIQKYDNTGKIEQRILHFMKHYEYTDNILANEISKQFNLTLDSAMKSIGQVKEKFPNVKRSRKVLKKLENIPKYKPPGIGIEIQGKYPDRYKIRISGARNKEQLDRIIQFMNILIYLYLETYLLKVPERQIYKEKLKKLTNIAQRRNKVETITNIDSSLKSVKVVTNYDKKRLGFRPEKGQNQWTRSCQNSGNEKRRRPTLITSVEELIDRGFNINPETGIYEKKHKIKVKGRTKEVLLRAVGLPNVEVNEDDNKNGLDAEDDEKSGFIYYTCSPKENGDHMFIGFLSRSNNPYGYAMPCCFKKDHYESLNKVKKDTFIKHATQDVDVGEEEDVDNNDPSINNHMNGDFLYILQDTNKIQENRLGILPKYMDVLFNQSLGNTRILKSHRLIKTSCYYYKYGIKQDENNFLSAVAATFDKTVSQIKDIIIKALEKDTSNMLFNALNNGEIRSVYTKEQYITLIKIGLNIPYHLIYHILTIPNIIIQHGCNFIVYEKRTSIIKNALDKEKVRDDFVLMCGNDEEYDSIYSLHRNNVIMVKEEKFFYPIVRVQKENDDNRDVDVQKMYKYNPSDKNNIIKHISSFYIQSCQINYISDILIRSKVISAKNIYNAIFTNFKEHLPKYQVIDAKFKTKYLVIDNDIIIPTKPSGSIYNLPIKNNMKPKTFDQTLEGFKVVKKILQNLIDFAPNEVYVTRSSLEDYKNAIDAKIDENKKYDVIAIVSNIGSVPIIKESVPLSKLQSLGLLINTTETYDIIDNEILKVPNNIIYDDRINRVQYDKYFDEGYEIFRLELSVLLSEHPNIKKEIMKVRDSKSPMMDRIHSTRVIIYKLIDNKLYDIFVKNVPKPSDLKGGGIKITTTLPNISKYSINNSREICGSSLDKDTCEKSLHCKWDHNKCHYTATDKIMIKYINKVSDELVNNPLRAAEILNLQGYEVSDIVDYNVFPTKENQKIIKSTNTTLNKFLIELFGKDGIPNIGKRRFLKSLESDLDLNIVHSLRDMGNYYIQKVFENNLSVLRAYANSYNWLMNPITDMSIRNLKYYSKMQTDYASFFRSLIIDWLFDKTNEPEIFSKLFKYLHKSSTASKRGLVLDYINAFTREVTTNTNCVIELYIMNKIFGVAIIVYNDQNDIIYVFDNGVAYDKYYSKDPVDSKYRKDLNKYINIKFSIMSAHAIPSNIESYYYK